MNETIDPPNEQPPETHPVRIYKYRSFSNPTIEMLVEDTLFYADPSTFNDPLDTRPTLKADVDAMALEEMLRIFVERRTTAEMKAAAKTIRYQGPRTVEHILKLGRHQADRLLQEIAYNATDPTYEMDDPAIFLLRSYVERELLRQYDKGIVSMSERWESLRIPMKPAIDSETKPATCSDFIPASIPI